MNEEGIYFDPDDKKVISQREQAAQAAALEAAARTCEDYGCEGDNLAREYASETAAEIAARIRKLVPAQSLSLAALAVERAAKSIEARAANWAGNGEPGATAASIDIRAELLNEATAVRALITPDQRTALQAALDAARLPLEEAIIDLLSAADCTWYENNAGHDWREAVDAARERVRASRETP